MEDSNLAEKKALADFLLDIDCLQPLAKYTSGVNIFEVLKITKTEIRHSNMLAWLLNPNENHGLGDQFLRGVFQLISEPDSTQIFKILLADFSSFTIHREYHNIDLLLVSDKAKIVLCIENKIDSDEHDNQLKKYQDFIENKYSAEWSHYYVFLSPDGRSSSDPENWYILSYSQIADILQYCMKQISLTVDSRMILEHYLKIIRRDIVTDQELIRICNEIYTKHQKALDLIFENRFDSRSVVYEMIVEWCKNKSEEGAIIFDEKDCNKSYIHFSTANLNQVYPLLKGEFSGWNNNHSAFYEISNYGSKIRVSCCVSSMNLSEELKKQTQEIANSHSTRKEIKENWRWKTIYSVKQHSVEAENGKLLGQEEINHYLDDSLKKIQEFERDILKTCKK